MAERDWLETERYAVAIGEPLKRLLDVLYEAGQVPFPLGRAGHRQDIGREGMGERERFRTCARPLAHYGAF
jgi:hypothetical protein